ncbi:MAG: hypothetical protein ACFFAS_15200 [Promethearchaeota archaeon]
MSDPDGDVMTVTFYDASDDTVIGTIYGVTSGGTATVMWQDLTRNTNYEWYAVADDGSLSTQSGTFSFRVEGSCDDTDYFLIIGIIVAITIIGILSVMTLAIIKKRVIN